MESTGTEVISPASVLEFCISRYSLLDPFCCDLRFRYRAFSLGYWHGDRLRRNHNSVGNSGGNPELFPNSSFPKQVFQVYLHDLKGNRCDLLPWSAGPFCNLCFASRFWRLWVGWPRRWLSHCRFPVASCGSFNIPSQSCKFPLDKTFLWQQRHTQGTRSWSWHALTEAVTTHSFSGDLLYVLDMNAHLMDDSVAFSDKMTLLLWILALCNCWRFNYLWQIRSLPRSRFQYRHATLLPNGCEGD